MSETVSPPGGPTPPPTPVTAPTTTEPPAANSIPQIATNLLADPVEPVVETAPETPVEPEKPAEPAALEYKDLKMPEGLAADDPLAAPFVAEAAKLGIPQDKVEALLATTSPQILEALKAPYQSWVDTQTAWQKTVMEDPEIGGAKFAAMKATVAKVLDDPALTDPGLREALNFTGAGNHPAVIRSMFRWAQRLTEGGPVSGGKPPAQEKTVASVLYPNLP